jgi:hypothetical protein
VFWKRLFSFFRGIRQVCFLLILAVVALFAYLDFYGLPQEWKRVLLGELAQRGVLLEIGTLHFDPLRGVVAKEVRYDLPNRPGAYLQVGEIALDVDLIDMLRKRFSVETVKVDGAQIELHPPGHQPPVCVQRTRGRIRFASDGVVFLDSIVGDSLGLRVEINGRLDLSPSQGARPSESSGARTVTLEKLRPWLDRLSSVKTSAPVLLRLDVDGKLSDPKTLRGKAEVRGESVVYEGWHADRVEGEVAYENGSLRVPWIAVSAAGGRIGLSGEADLRTGLVRFELTNTLDPRAVFSRTVSYVPSWLKEMEFGVRPEFWIKGAVNLGREDVWQSMDADASFWLRETAWRDHLLREVKGNARISVGRISLPNLSIKQELGGMTGSLEYELANATLRFDVHNTLDLSEIMMLLYPSEKNWFRTVRYTKPSLLRLAGSWRIRDPQGLQAKGHMNWQDWSANETPIQSTTAQVEIDGRRFVFRDLTIRREEGELKGDLTLDFNTENAHLDAVSTIEFVALARIIGPKTEETFRPYHFITPPRLQLRGRVHFGNRADNDFYAHVECDQFKVWRLAARKVSGDVRSYRNSLEIARYQSEFYGGSLTGDAVFDFTRPQGDWAFHCQVARADFDQLTHDLWNYEEVAGLMTGWADVNGEMESSRPLKGKGYVMVNEGVLWRIPLFGELSKFIPVLGEHKATKAYAGFNISDQTVHIPDLRVSAGLLSLTAKGNYKFDDSVDFIVQAHFLRALGFGYVFDVLTKPLEYHLGGKLNKRKWKPRFIPKEMLLQFGDDNEEPPPEIPAPTKS